MKERRREGPGRASFQAVLVGIVLALCAGCRSYDPDVFDERLRAATVDAYVAAIETQFGGLAAAEIDADQLRARYRAAAVAAENPATFYSVLRAMLADLDDPHATLRVSSRFWSGPVAEPERVRFVRSRGAVWMGAPPASLRTNEELDAELSGWLTALGAVSLGQLDQVETAKLLRMSAAYGGRDGDRRSQEPLTWLRVTSIDDVPIETPHDAELMARGDLGTRARVVVMADDGPADLALLRNAGVFEDDHDAGVRRRLGPLELASLLDPAADESRRNTRPTALRLRFRDPLRRPFRRGLRIDLPERGARAFAAEAWILRTPENRPVGYLRIGSFRSREAIDASSKDEGERRRESLDEVLAHAFDEFSSFDHIVVDLTGNPGGSWQETGLFISYFLPPETEVVPHEVVSVAEARRLFIRMRTREVQRLQRVDVPYVLPRDVQVLVDQDTASAGEIAASALRGVAGAVLIGERTAGAEYSTAEFVAPDGSVLTIGLSGGMMAPLEAFQGVGLEPDIEVAPFAAADEPIDLEAWRASYRYRALADALDRIDWLEAREAAHPSP